MQDFRQPTFRQQRFDEGRQSAGRPCADELRTRPVSLRPPAPFETVVDEVADRLAVPGDDEIERRFVDCGFIRTWPCQQILLVSAVLMQPSVLASKWMQVGLRLFGRAV